MKKVLSNIRFIILLFLSDISFILCLSEQESFIITVVMKLQGVILAYSSYILAKFWHRKGYLKEWDEWSAK